MSEATPIVISAHNFGPEDKGGGAPGSIECTCVVCNEVVWVTVQTLMTAPVGADVIGHSCIKPYMEGVRA